MIGGGSWATALVKILAENKVYVTWYLRRNEQADAVNKFGANPDYLSFVSLNKGYIAATNDLDKALDASTYILFAIPSAHLPGLIGNMESDCLTGKKVIVSIKGTVGESNLLPSSYISTCFGVLPEDVLVIGGPCHAEEIGLNRKTYITLASLSESFVVAAEDFFSSPYIQINRNLDPVGVEYAAIYKNIIGIVCGMAKGLKYGDNFIAVLVANAIAELGQLMQCINPHADMGNSSYLGDLLVTAYSEHSRNRAFGELIGRGYDILNIKEVTYMVAEGYPATKGMYETAQQLDINMPIVNTAYRILYKHMPVSIEFKLLERSLK